MQNEKTTEEVALGIRRRVFEHTMRNNGGYLSQACSAAEQLAFLYNEALNLGQPVLPMIPEPFRGVPSADNPGYVTGAGYNGPFEPHFDRLFIAPAHYALVAYATLIETGRMAPEGLEMFNRDGSSVEMIGAEHSPGMEVHNGTLGIGLSTGAGLAWGRKRRGETGRHHGFRFSWPNCPPCCPASYQLSILSAAIKASCGISTLPNWRMRFLPAFCLSSSLRLRVTSPP